MGVIYFRSGSKHGTRELSHQQFILLILVGKIVLELFEFLIESSKTRAGVRRGLKRPGQRANFVENAARVLVL